MQAACALAAVRQKTAQVPSRGAAFAHARALSLSALTRSASMAPRAEQYSTQSYWNKRYAKGEEKFEWYQRYATLKHVITLFAPRDEPVLQVGVGNSQLQVDMVLDGYTSILSIDYADVVIAQLQKAHVGHPQLQYAVADARTMPQYQSSSFASILDKGTIDAMACGDHAYASIGAMLTEASRLLKPGGRFVGISYGSPKTRMHCFTDCQLHWDAVLYTVTKPSNGTSDESADQAPVVEGPFEPEEALRMPDSVSDKLHYVYVCQKQPDTATNN